MKHYSQMSDEELGSEVYGRHIDAANTATLGASIRRMLDSMKSDELATVKDEVDRTARVVMALSQSLRQRMSEHEGAQDMGDKYTQGERRASRALDINARTHDLRSEEALLLRLRARQRELEAARDAKKDGAK